MSFHVPPAPALTMTEARSIYEWLSHSPYPKDDYENAKAALGKVRAIARVDVPPSTQEKP